jgi:PAS domain S-box-containing protein
MDQPNQQPHPAPPPISDLERMTEHSDLILWSTDEQCRLMAFNTKFRFWLHELYAVDAERGQSALIGVMADWDLRYRLAMAERRPQRFEQAVELEGHSYVVQVGIFPILKDGQLAGTAVVARNITAEQAALQHLQAANRRFQALLNQADDIFWISQDGKLVYINDAFESICAVSKSDLLDPECQLLNWVHPEDRPGLASTLASEQYQRLGYFRAEVRWIRPTDQETRWMLARSFPLEGGAGGSRLVLGMAEDITSLKRSQERLMMTNSQLEAMLENTQDMVFSLDRQFRYMGFNQRHRQTMDLLFGGIPIVGRSIFECVPAYAEPLRATLGIALAGKTHTEDIAYGKGLTSVYFDFSCTPIISAEGEAIGVSVFARDVTAKRKAEHRMEKSSRLLTSINRNIKEAIYRSAPGGGIKYVNQAFLDMFRIGSRQEALSKTAVSLYANPSMRQEVALRLQEHGHITNMEIAFQRADGEVFWGLLSSTKYESDNGEVYFDGAIRDITALRAAQSELELRNEELRKTNEALDRFVYSASHDLKAPLRSISGLLQIFKMDRDEDRRTQYLERMQESVKKLEGFIADIVDYSRNARQELQWEEIPLRDFMGELLEELRYAEGMDRIQVSLSVTGIPALRTDRTRLQAICRNLISNAVHYADLSKESPSVEIEVVHHGHSCAIRIADNGIGIAEEHLPKIFEMFFRASRSGKGSGIGLYIVKEAIEKLKGRISASSILGEGTEFVVTIPHIDAVATAW